MMDDKKVEEERNIRRENKIETDMKRIMTNRSNYQITGRRKTAKNERIKKGKQKERK